jgi:hypothetical protein
MTTAADIQMICNADPGAVLPGINTMSGNPHATSALLDATKITQDSKAAQAGVVLSSINLGTATVVKTLKALLVSSLLAGFAPLAQAHIVYPGCYVPPDNAIGKLWYFDPVYGTTVSGGADGSKAHPFKDLSYAFQTGQNGWAAGAGYPEHPLISTQSYDHYPKTGPHGTRIDEDYNPAAPDPARINPGDAIVLETGSYGSLIVAGYYGAASSLVNVDANGNTDAIFVQNDTGASPLFTTIQIGGGRGFVFHGLRVESTNTASATNHLVGIGGASQDIILENSNIGSWGTSLPGSPGFAPTGAAVGMPPWTQAQWLANMMMGVVLEGAYHTTTGQPTGALNCIAVNSNNVRYVNHGIGMSALTKSVFENNTISHFSGDGMDPYSSTYITIQGNVITDRFDTGNGDHPDGIQLAGTNIPGTFTGVTIYHNYIKQLADPVIGTVVGGVQTPPPGFLQGIDDTNNSWDHLIVEDNYINAEACLILNFGSVINSKIVNNTAVWSGDPKDACYPWLTVGSATGVRSNNLVQNNVITGSVWRPSCTNGDVWKNNRVYRIVAAGAVQSITPSSICISNGNGTLTYWDFVGAGTYDGVVIDASTPMQYVFTNYAPTSPLSQVNPTPTPYGPLYGTGASLKGLDIPGPDGGINGVWPLGANTPDIGAL